MTLFNRGKTNPELFPDLEKLRGDRDGELGALVGRAWDAVIDTSGYVPRHVRLSAELLAPSVAHYLFISTISVYRDYSTIGMDETAPIATLADPTTEQVTGETYGALKALCEKAAEDAMPGRTTVIRPGLIVGPEDRTDRFTYWPVRVERGGEVLSPGTPADPIQFIDVRDLAEFIVVCLENKVLGTFNADAPAGALSMGKLLETCREVSGSGARPDLGRGGLPRAAEREPVAGHALLGAGGGRRGGLRQGEHGEGPRRRPGHAAAGRHGPRDPGLVAPGTRGPAQDPARGPGAGAGSRGSGGLAREELTGAQAP